jgi:sec-independent protein translocase protein TatC
MIRNLLRKLRYYLGAPFRQIARPFHAWRRFLNHEPEETPIADVFSQTLKSPSLLIEHIEALRRHLFRSLIVLAIMVVLSTFFATRILDWLSVPIGGIEQLQSIEVTESLGVFMRVVLITGFVLALPYIGFEVFAFLNPGLRRQERVLILTAIPFSTLLFLLGMAFAYFVMLPTALPFLLDFMGITTVPRPANYIRFVTGMMFWIGISFQFPLIIYALAGLGIVDAKALRQGWRIAIIAIAVLAAAITPTIDPVNMGLVMAPMILLYFLSIGLAAFAGRRRARGLSQDS